LFSIVAGRLALTDGQKISMAGAGRGSAFFGSTCCDRDVRIPSAPEYFRHR
jgi:hypothetical protein